MSAFTINVLNSFFSLKLKKVLVLCFLLQFIISLEMSIYKKEGYGPTVTVNVW